MTAPSMDMILSIRDDRDFQSAALEVFRYQYGACEVYRRWVDLLGLRPDQVRRVEDIPALPIELFKNKTVVSFAESPMGYFQSSGTTGMTHSRHYYRSLDNYDRSLLAGFRLFWGDPGQYCIVALLPNYLQQGHSSLIHMMQLLIAESHCPQSGFHEAVTPRLMQLLAGPCPAGRRLILFGVTYALLDILERQPVDLHDAVVFETGGMKGRREEMVKPQLHERLCAGFHVPAIASEYGMCELFSQAYSCGQGLFAAPPWMKIRIRDLHAPARLLPAERTGGIDVIDLANLDSCSFIGTEDLGKWHALAACQERYPSATFPACAAAGLFEVLGRIDHSALRGCNLMAEL